MEQAYEEIDSVQAANAEIVISKTLHQGSNYRVVIAPRKSYYDKTAALDKLYIPRFSSIEFSDVSQVEDFLAALIDACRRIFDEEPRRLYVHDDSQDATHRDAAFGE